MGKKIIVIGGVGGGANAATKARRVDEGAEIIIYEKSPYVSFANCGLPYHIGGEIKQRDDLFLVSVERFANWYNVKVKIKHEVLKIDRSNKKLLIHNLDTDEQFWEDYDKLIISTGGTPYQLPIAGVDLENVKNLWTIQDMDQILAAMEDKSLQRVAVVGGGFIGLEMMEAFAARGYEVTLIEREEQILPAIDHEMTLMIDNHLKDHNVKVMLGRTIERFEGENGKVKKVVLDNGLEVEAELVVISAGVKPNLELLTDAGIELGETGAVKVDQHMQTNDPDIYAAGDIVETTNLLTGKKMRMPLAGPASKQGRVAGSNAAGGNLQFKGALGTFIVKICDLSAAKTGLTEKELKDGNLDYCVSYSVAKNHAGYYPGAEWMIIKLILEKPTGRIIGAQIVGPKGVDKRIDVLATAIQAKMTAEDLENLDLAYAPPYAPTKDPVIIAGMAAANMLRGEVETITVNEYHEALKSGEEIQLIDCRGIKDIDFTGRVPEAEVMPLEEFREWLEDIDPDVPVVAFCGIGYRSYMVYRILKHHGIKAKSLAGGYSMLAGKTPK